MWNHFSLVYSQGNDMEVDDSSSSNQLTADLELKALDDDDGLSDMQFFSSENANWRFIISI
jgi:hypothetical protein